MIIKISKNVRSMVDKEGNTQSPETKQQSLLAYDDDRGKKIILNLKQYIQPFERILAQSELAGLLEPGLINNLFETPANNSIIVTTNVSSKALLERLAYWETITSDTKEMTLQVLFEYSMNGKTSIGKVSDSQLHKTRRLRYGPHDIHEYRGKFFPQLVRSLINSARLEPEDLVLDPMCGSGTTNVEARVINMSTIGLDINPLSVKIARTKTELLELDPIKLGMEMNGIIDTISDLPIIKKNEIWNDNDYRYLKNWFDENALFEISSVLSNIRKNKNEKIRDLAELSLSNIIRKISLQKESDLRVRKEIKEYNEGMCIELLINEINSQLNKLVPYLSLFKNIENMPYFKINEGNSKEIDYIMRKWVGECDLIITSPPYATALPYLDTDRLSLVVLGLLTRRKHKEREQLLIGSREVSEKQRQIIWETYLARKSDLPPQISSLIDKIATVNHGEGVGFRRRNLPALLGRYFLDMYDSMEKHLKMLKKGRYAFYVVGNNSTLVNNVNTEIPTDRFLWEIGKKLGWEAYKIIDMELLPSRDIFRKNRGTVEKILIFKKKGG